MNNTKELIFNERAWAIQIISEINKIVSDKSVNYAVKSAGGEFGTASTSSTVLFPDVILFGDARESLIIQGWELKTPETDIGNVHLMENAKEKAHRMKTTSFVLWNGRIAILYVHDTLKGWQEFHRWTDHEISSREELGKKPGFAMASQLCRSFGDIDNQNAMIKFITNTFS